MSFTRTIWHELGIVPTTGLQFWHSYEAGVVSGAFISDPSGNDRHLFSSGTTPVLQTNVFYGQPGWYINGSTTVPLATATDDSIPLRHYFILAAYEDTAFDLNRGLVSGHTANDLLTSNNSGTKFFDLSFGAGFEYRKSNVIYTEANQQAPMSNFELIEVVLPVGSALDGLQIGRQRDIAGRIWKGWFIDHMGFDAILTARQRRRVLLYYSLRYGVHIGSDIPLYFPSSDLIGTGVVSDGGVIRNRFYNVPRDWEPITESYEFEDSNKTFNEVGDDPPRRWEYRYQNISKEQATIFDAFNDTARKAVPFYFKDPEGRVWSNVHIENYNRDHDSHKRWVHEASFNLVGYKSTWVFEGDNDESPPTVPTGLTLETLSGTEIELTWGASTD
jgi:hypothetical protein